MRIEPLYQEFLTYLELEQGCSPLTITSYRSDGKLFVESLGDLGLEPQIDVVNGHVVRRYIAYLSQRGQKSSSIARRLCSLRSFWRYRRDSDYTQSDPFVRISAPSKELGLPNYLSAQECAALLDAAERQRSIFLAFRDKAALAALVFTGLRRGEILSLRLPSLDLADNKVVVRRGKGRKTRVIPMVAQLRDTLGDWLEVRPNCDHDFAFTTQSGARMAACHVSGVSTNKAVAARPGASWEVARSDLTSGSFGAAMQLPSSRRQGPGRWTCTDAGDWEADALPGMP